MNKIKESNQSLLQKNLTNDYTNTNLGQTYLPNKIDEKNNNKDLKKEEITNNHEEIIIRSNKYRTSHTIIEVKLPNPYLDTECVKYKRYIDYNVKSKFKSKYADYINSKSTLNSKNEIRNNKTLQVSSSKIEQHIYFTKLNNKQE